MINLLINPRQNYWEHSVDKRIILTDVKERLLLKQGAQGNKDFKNIYNKIER